MNVTKSRNFLQILLLVLLSTLVFGSSTLIFRLTEGFFLGVKTQIIHILEERTGSLISYDAVSPSIFQFIEMKNFRLARKSDPAHPLIAINRLKVYFDLMAILTGSPEKALKELGIENSQFSLDTQRDKDFFDFLKEISEGPGGEIPQVTVSGSNLEIEFTDGSTAWRGKEVFFRLDQENEVLNLDLRGTVSARGLPGVESLDGSLSLRGQSLKSFLESEWQLEVKNLDTPLVAVRNQVFQVSWTDPQLKVVKIKDSIPLDLTLHANLSKPSFSLSFLADGLNMSSIFNLKGPWARWNGLVPSQVRGEGEVVYAEDQLSYRWNGGFVSTPDKNLPALQVTGALRGNQREMVIPEIKVTAGSGQMAYSGKVDLLKLNPQGLVRFDDFQLPGYRPANGLVRLRPTGAAQLELFTESFQYGSLRLVSARALLLRDPAGFGWDVDLRFDPGSRNVVQSVKTLGSFRNTGSMEVRWDVNSLGLDPFWEELQAWLPDLPRDLPERLSLTTRGEGTLNRSSWQVRVENLSLDSTVNAGRNLYLEGDLSPGIWNLNRLDFRWDDLRATLGSQGTWSTDGLVAGFVSGKVNSQDYRVEGTYKASTGEGQINGLYGTDISFLTRDGLNGSLSLKTKGFPLAYQDLSGTLDVDLKARWSPEDWEVEIFSFRGQSPRIMTLNNVSVFLQGTLRPDSLDLPVLEITDSLSPMTGRLKADYVSTNLSTWRAQFLMESTTTPERYIGTVENRNDRLQGELELQSFRLRRLGQNSIRGTLNTKLQLKGTLAQWSLTGDGEIKDGTFNRDPFSTKFSLDFTPTVFQVRNMDLLYLGNKLEQLQARLDLETGRTVLSSKVETSLGKKSLSARLGVEAEFRQNVGLGSLQDIFTDRLVGRLLVTDTRYGLDSLEDFTLNFSKIKNITTFRGGVGNILQGRISDEGDFRIVARSPMPVQFSAEGKIGLDKINAQFSDFSLDIRSLRETVDLPLFTLEQGSVTGNFLVNGPPGDPDLQGLLNLRKVVVASPFLREKTEPLDTTMEFKGKELVLSPAPLVMGSGRGSAEGVFKVDHWSMDSFDLRFLIPDLSPLPLSYKMTGVDAQGLISGLLYLKGNPFQAKLTGDLYIQDVNLSVANVVEAAEGGDYGFGVDLNLRTGRQVAFLWPADSLSVIPILRAYLKVNQTVSIKLDENTGQFAMTGDMELRGGEINLPTQSFFLREGVIRFKENNTKFDPWIRIRGEMRAKDDQGVYTISLLVDDFLSRFSPRFDASPSRPQEQVLAVVGSTFLPGAEYSRLNLDTALSLASDVGTSFILRPFEDAVKKTFNLDLFTVRTDVFKKAILATTTPDAALPQNYLDNTSLFLGKYVGDVVFLEGLLSWKTEKSGVEGQPDVVKPELELGMEYQTPLFLFNWRVTPSDPSSLFIKDNEVSFIWKFTY